jgi:hypothetical protein
VLGEGVVVAGFGCFNLIVEWPQGLLPAVFLDAGPPFLSFLSQQTPMNWDEPPCCGRWLRAFCCWVHTRSLRRTLFRPSWSISNPYGGIGASYVADVANHG